MDIFSYKYAIPYLLFLGYLFVLMIGEFNCRGKDTKIIRWLAMGGILFFFGLRGFVYTDWYNYYPYFEKLPTLWNGNFLSVFQNSKSDIGFNVYSSLIKSVVPNYFFWTFVSCLIDVVILNLLFKRYARYYVVAFIVFFIFGGDILEINLMRNVKAILLFMLSLKYLEQRKIVLYMLLNILGTLFHISSIVFLPLYFLLHREFSKILLWSIFIVGNIIFLFQLSYIRPLLTFLANIISPRILLMVQNYFATEVYNKPYGLSLGYIERVVSYALIIWLYPKLKQQNSSNAVFVNIFILYFICFFYLAEIRVISVRMSFLFICSYWILYPNLYALVQKYHNKLVILVLFYIMAIGKVFQSESNFLQKYDNLLFGIEKYESRKEKVDKHSDEIFKKE